jgi:hypothetical protein
VHNRNEEDVMLKDKPKTRKPVVVKLVVRKIGTRDITAHAEPDTAVMFVGDTIKWTVDAGPGIRNVRPDHFRLKRTWIDPTPFFAERPRMLKGKGEFTAKARKSGLVRVYKYDIMVGNAVVADPDVQIKDRG